MDPSNAPGDSSVRRIELETDDGVELVGDFAVPAGPRAAAVLCHPHPQYGGTRFDAVVTALFEVLPPAGVAALRFDFRREFGGGVEEIRDAAAAVDELTTAVPDVPVTAAGYSFGALVVLSLDHPAVTAKVLLAPPLGALPMTGPPPGEIPTLVLTPEHDQFCPPDQARPVVAGWRGAELRVVPSTDHFLTGRRRVAAELARDWVDAQLRRASGPSADGTR